MRETLVVERITPLQLTAIMFHRIITATLVLAVLTPFFPKPDSLRSRLRTLVCEFAKILSNETQECNNWLHQLEKQFNEILEQGANWVRTQIGLKLADTGMEAKIQQNLRSAFDYEYEKQALQEMDEYALSGERMINELRFHRYEETNLCNVKQGIEVSNYDKFVERIAMFVNIPDKLTLLIKEAKDLEDGEVLALEKLSFSVSKGNMVFGKVVVIKRKGKIDLAYSMHGVEYDISTRQPTEKAQLNAKKFESFEESLKADEVVKGDKARVHDVAVESEKDANDYELSLKHRNAFEAFFQKKAIQKFSSHCTRMMKKVFKTDSPVLKVFEVQTEEIAEQPQHKQAERDPLIT